ncbi:MAG: GNAT family N-acetyltransferase [Eubacteriales bacterium]|nr:GNAT family N-acetyltransferase [Lachnospiraceae bacterium]MDO5126189.1 GNAT family N-acetyltransferase [Eubacteriales bacterium]
MDIEGIGHKRHMGEDYIIVREFNEQDIPSLREIWNNVVEEGNAFPQTEPLLDDDEALDFFATQSYTGVAELDSKIVGLYVLHPNNIGRCGHIANASYAVDVSTRGVHIGEKLVKDSLYMAGKKGFGILQFNAVVASNETAIALYEKLEFERIGTIPNGFLNKNNEYEDIILFYHTV